MGRHSKGRRRYRKDDNEEVQDQDDCGAGRAGRRRHRRGVRVTCVRGEQGGQPRPVITDVRTVAALRISPSGQQTILVTGPVSPQCSI